MKTTIMFYKSTTFSIILFAMAFLISCGGKDQKQMGFPPVNVSTHQVSTADAAYYEEYPAVVRALQEVELRAQVNGYITGIHFQEGQQVKKGQKLYTIDQQQSEASYQQALANLAVQEANLERAKRDVERYRELDKNDAIAKQQVDYAEATYSAAQKQVEAAKAAVRGVQTSVRYTSITAPFNGTIGISQVRLGSSVSPGQTLLNTISSDDPMAADIVVDQSEIYRFSELLATRSANEKDSTFRLSFKGEDYPYPGAISIIDRAVDPTTGTIKMRFSFANPKRILRAGMSGTLKVLTKSQGTIVIPAKAVNEQLGEYYVYLADSAKATQRKVLLGKQVGRNIIIREGLTTGDVIITEGLQNLREGSPINVASSPVAKQ
jgi:membrane fusion protein, multidrug efflux system